MAARKTAAQKAAEAAEREEYTGIPENHVEDANAARQAEAPAKADATLSKVKDDKTGKFLTIQQLKNKLRNEAEREVLDTHKAEVVTITAAKYKEHNLEYVRRLTEEEKAAEQIEKLYAQFPHLRPQVEQQQAQAEEIPDAVVDGLIADGLVQAVPGGPLEQFRNGGHAAPYYAGEPDVADYADVEVEAREGE
jgi:hypothetical protein